MESKELTELLLELAPENGEVVIIDMYDPDIKYQELINRINEMNAMLHDEAQQNRYILNESFHKSASIFLD